ncbi:hypothetical protein [Actinomadura algeriensis]|uniref:Uncharacterized protein n=1 Tax=Actinomadura algeriensis TaxID=1679523 RepID=A0ABR9JPU2_9ACTN|nr:hypothetical protein [Actinomadura algeriensis]MBE1532513.1 hypothetical protein [Actinomadura algeriensis]
MEHYWSAGGRDVADEIRDVGGIVNDYPSGDPFLCISVLAADAEDAVTAAADDPSLPVLGLVAIVPYLCWRSRDAALNGRVREALQTVAAALATPPCPHGDTAHPCDSEQASDDFLYAMEALAGLDGEEPDDAGGLWACPKNLAALARQGVADMDETLAEDGPVALAAEGIYAPELQDVPDVFFAHVSGHLDALITGNERARAVRPKWIITQLFQMLRREPPWDDAPEDDHRGWLLWCARELSMRPDGPAGAGLVLALSSAYTYAMSDEVPERAVRDELIEAFSEAHRVRRDAPCPHAGEHPALGPEERLVAAARLWDPAYTDAEVEARPVTARTAEAAACPAHLRDIALRAANDLRRDVAERFGPSAGADLDARYLDADGTLRADRLARDVRFHNAGPSLEASPAVWCARRVLAGTAEPRERAALVSALAHAVRHPHWYAGLPGAAAVLAEALIAVAAADPGECDHTGGHTAGDVDAYTPPVIGRLIPAVHDSHRFELPWRHPEQRAFTRPNPYTDAEGPGPARWRCPVHLADLARRALAGTAA